MGIGLIIPVALHCSAIGDYILPIKFCVTILRLPEMEKSKKRVNQEEFLRQMNSKAAEQLKKVQRENREKEMTQVMYQCLTGMSLQGLDMVDLNDLGWLIDQHLKGIYKKLEQLKKEVTMSSPPPLHQYQMGGQRDGFEIMGMNLELQQSQSWFMNLMSPDDHMSGYGYAANDRIGGVGDSGDNEVENQMLMTFADCSKNVNPLWSIAFMS
ncbi:hypothetical protein Droror1_Dr00022932 [Drosera rotundifolia]